jgi:hypothetical protein
MKKSDFDDNGDFNFGPCPKYENMKIKNFDSFFVGVVIGFVITAYFVGLI